MCKGADSDEFLTSQDRFSDNESDHFSLRHCLNCGMIFLNPRPTERESGKYYQHEDYLPFSSTDQADSPLHKLYRFGRRMNLRWKRGLVDRFWRVGIAKGPGLMLDVGCGTGEFLGTMKRAGWKVQGIERDEKASDWARRSLEIPVHTGDLMSFASGGRKFDVITLWHVLEHLYDPSAAIGRFRELLSDEGFLLIAVPNVGGTDAKVYGRNWVALDLPRHVNHFSGNTLVRLVSSGGFSLLARRQLPFDSAFNAMLSEQLSAQRAGAPLISWPFRLVRVGATALASLIGGSVLFRANFGPTLVFLFRKAPPSPLPSGIRKKSSFA